MPGTPSTDRLRLAARVRAAIAYSGLRTDQVAKQLGDDLSVATLRRITSSTNPRGASLDTLTRIADVCGVPVDWLEYGWDSTGGPTRLIEAKRFGNGTTAERLATVERVLELMLTRLEGAQAEALEAALEPEPAQSSAK